MHIKYTMPSHYR